MDGRFRRAVGTRLLHRYTWTWSCIRQIAHKPGPSRPLGEPKTSAAVGVLAKSVAKYVPLTFTSITQVQRLIPDEERKVLDASGGLIAVLQAHPSLFTVRRFGAVDAARRLLSVIPESNETNTPPPPAPSTPAAVEAVVLPQLRSIFPSFLVPVRALWRDGDAAQCAQRQSQILQIIEDSRCRQFLQYVPYPGREGTIEAGYVRLSVCVPTPTGKSEHSPDLQYANFEVEPYEWYRVAALLPSTAPVPITDELQQRAAEILQPNQHDLMHVLLSGPHLFRVSVGALSSSPSVAFLLHPKFPILAENDTVESIQRELLHLEASRSTSTYKMNFSARRRMLRRKLEFLHAPTPLFNEHVFLQYLVDQLPERTAVTLTSFVANLPQSLVMHFPSSIKRFLQMHPHFFFVFHMDGDGEACVQRADAPRPESRPIESIAVEEVLMAIFVRYPMKRHPHNGICVFQVLASLSPAHVDRLYDITDVEAWLRQCPDKVEILTPFPQQDSHHTKQENSTPMSPEEERPFTVSADKIVSARGRTDFFVRFRYIGEWQEKLLERYSKAHPSQSA